MNFLNFKTENRLGGSNKQERRYLDFIISGQSLRKILNIENSDLISPLGWSENKDYEKEILQIFQLRKKSDLETKRVMLYVCPECGDIDCGAITANVVDLGDRIIWKDFGYETGYGGVTKEYEIEPIEFERQSYFQALSTIK